MKKIITSSFVAILLFSFFTFAQDANDKSYETIKANFYKQYLVYKNNLQNGIMTVKPTDPSGLFAIDDNNNLSLYNTANKESNNNYSHAPWINGSPDAVSGYTFAQSTTTYTPAYGGTLLCSGGCDDGNHSGIAIPFTFTYNGTAYTTVSISHNGWMVMGTQLPSGYSPICTGSYPNVLAPFARDLYGLAAGDSLRYLTTGVTPNRIFTVEWSKWGIYSSGLNELDFQVQLYETSNIIKFVYKPETPTTSVADVQVGLMGATNVDYNTRTTATNWSATTPGVACSYNTFSSTIYPANGLTFTWTPPASSNMTYVLSTAVQITPGLNIAQSSINNQIIQVQVVMSGTDSAINLTSMNFNTTGSTNPADFLNAKVYYTGTSNVFATTTLF